MKIKINKNSIQNASDRLLCSAGFQTCCVADFQIGGSAGLETRDTADLEVCATKRNRLIRAFTLVEIMLVVVIIGILAALVIPRIAGKSEEARETAAYADINGGIKTALDGFEVDMGYYPSSLQDLLQQPRNARNWHGPYLDNLPIDPWGNAYLYSYPGKHNPNGYDLWSSGPPNEKHEIGNWQSSQ